MGDRLGIPGAVGFCLLFLLPPPPLTPGGAPFPTPPAACPFAADHPAPGPTGRRRVRCPALQPRSPGHTPWPAGPRSLRPRPLPVHKAAAAALKAQAPGCLPAQASTFAAPALGGGGAFSSQGRARPWHRGPEPRGRPSDFLHLGPLDTHLAWPQIPGQRTSHTPHPTAPHRIASVSAGRRPETGPRTNTPACSARTLQNTRPQGEKHAGTQPKQ